MREEKICNCLMNLVSNYNYKDTQSDCVVLNCTKKLKVIGINYSRLDKASNNEITEFCHVIKSYLLGNDELTKLILQY